MTTATAPSTTTNSTALSHIESKLMRVDEVVAITRAGMAESVRPLQRSLRLAQGIQALRELITDELLDAIMPLQGSPLGFKTDKTYGRDVVREVWIEANLRGAYMAGNEVNILAGRCYLTKEYFGRAVNEFPGVSDVQVTLLPPQPGRDGFQIVQGKATFLLRGEVIEHEATIPVRVNNGQIVDSTLGKAERKLMARVYQRLTGIRDNDPDDVCQYDPALPSPEEQSQVREEPVYPEIMERFHLQITQSETETELAIVADEIAAAFKAKKITSEQRELLVKVYKSQEKKVLKDGRSGK